MVVQCPGCDTKYNIPVEKMGKGSTQLRCSRCGKQFTLEKPSEGDSGEVEQTKGKPTVEQAATKEVTGAVPISDAAEPTDDAEEAQEEPDADPAELVTRAMRAAEEATRAAEAAAAAKTAAEARRLAQEAARAAEVAKKAAEAATVKSRAAKPFAGEQEEWGDDSFEVPASEQTTEIDADALEFVDDDSDEAVAEPHKPPAPPPPPSAAKAPPPQPAPPASRAEDVEVDLLEEDEPSRETAPLVESADHFETGPSVIVDPSLSADDVEIPTPTPKPIAARTDDWEEDDQVVDAPPGGGFKILGVLMLLVLLLGGGALLYFFVISEGDESSFEGIDTLGVEFIMTKRAGGGQVLMVRGKVVNTTAGAKQHIAVRAQILEPGGAVVREKQAPCGRTWTAAELTKLSSAEIDTEYQRLEQSQRLVPPDGEITCSVVFEIIPTGFSVTSFRPRMIVMQAEPVVYSDQ
jgi:predicted Zn finger-like uncharacterized protein